MYNKDIETIKNVVDLDLELNLKGLFIDKSLKTPTALPISFIDDKVIANWLLPSGITDVFLELSSDDFVTINYSKKIIGNKIELKDLIGNVYYKYRLKAVFNEQESSYSEPIEFLSPYSILFLHNFNSLQDSSIRDNDLIELYGTSSNTALFEFNFITLTDTSNNSNNCIEVIQNIDTRLFECNFDNLNDDSNNNNNLIEINT